jgi:uncharacterized protein (TIGR02145 family)
MKRSNFPLALVAYILLFLFPGVILAQLPSYLPTNGLVAWYPFNGNANDESGNGNNGIVSGAVLCNDRNNDFQKAFQFDGLNDIINLPLNSGNTANSNQFSIQYWIIPDSIQESPQTVFANWHSIPPNPLGLTNLAVGFITGFAKYSGYNLYGSYLSNYGVGTNSNLFFSSWNHVVVVYNGNEPISDNRQRIYLNGVQQSNNYSCQNCLNNIPTTSGNILNHTTIGARYAGSQNALIDPFKGKLDDIAIYNRALTPSEVTALYTSTATNTGGGNTSTNPAPPGIPYQAEVRSDNGEILANANINVRFTLHELTANGTVSYQETHAITTNELGLFAATIGAGTATQGTFAGINWAQTTKFLQVEVDAGNGYITMGNQQLMSVPYALYAANGPAGPQGPVGPAGPQGQVGPQGQAGAAGIGVSEGNVQNQILFWNGTSWTTLNPGSNGQTLTICEGELVWTNRGICPGTITSFNCNSSTNLGTLRAETQSMGVSTGVPYTGGNGGSYPTLMIPSSGIQGLTATLNAGILESGEGSLVFIISGTPTSEGQANFSFTFNNQQCSFTRDVIPARESCLAIDVFNSTASYGSLTDQDGYKYKTIIIGEQEWMAENLNTSLYRNGDSILTGLSDYSWQYNTSGSWEYYNNDSTLTCPYGKLYNWFACTDSRGLCPAGWRMPSSADMNSLIQYLDSSPMDMSYNLGYEGLLSSNTAGGKLKSLGETYWQSPNITVAENTGFAALPAGGTGPNGPTEYSFGLGSLAYFWTSSRILNDPLSYVLSNETMMLGVDRNPGYFKFSVRCIKE